jgi:hypothetical protein
MRGGRLGASCRFLVMSLPLLADVVVAGEVESPTTGIPATNNEPEIHLYQDTFIEQCGQYTDRADMLRVQCVVRVVTNTCINV